MSPVYTPLEPSRSEIRVLSLLPDEHGGPVHCRLKIVSLDANPSPSFEALSYAWGGNSTTKPIKVDGDDMQVTASLERALRRLRRSDPRDIWADAVCINQTDNLEKNVQVPLMGRVYSEASKVLVWLGESNAYIDKAIASCRKSSGSPEAVASSLEIHIGIFDILSRPYWSRMWTFQEHILARDEPVLFCGAKKEFLGSEVVELWDLLPNLNEPNRAPMYSTQTIIRTKDFLGPNLSLQARVMGEISDRRSKQARAREFSLMELLFATIHRCCHNPRDHIYGLYGMIDLAAEDDGNPLPAVDYNQPHEEVFWNATVHIIRRRPPALFSLATSFSFFPNRFNQGACGNARYPSWVLDFASSGPEQPVFDTMTSFVPLHPKFSSQEPQNTAGSGGSSDANSSSRFVISHDRRMLHLDGWQLCSSFTTVLLETDLVALAAQIIKLFYSPPHVQDNQDEEQWLFEARQYRRRLATALNAVNPRMITREHNRGAEGAADKLENQPLEHRLLELLRENETNNVEHERFDMLVYMRAAILLGLAGKRLIFPSGPGGIGLTTCDAMDKRDVIVVCEPLGIPVVLRPMQSTGRYRMVSSAYVSGVMQDECFDSEVVARVKSSGISRFIVE
ncbi:hypothetical protein GGTG_09161 [Gaeumannomyces tritici R3-111a-1]|uniref:Heterokaryon incompatibility domain-containing protein n=1 Tax=Gaeumannomyces tritici (strain R3-111a-1) TaxID=644352 RepID=J3P6L9_GAET3|nr:hypothetical protein GGTG_09161 [Gaeumannomyces tritici R3-111a-1]EJT72295.1 hypothetical protein GGTG_09161 [Gaeumannomyces tritici R3-111a-1]